MIKTACLVVAVVTLVVYVAYKIYTDVKKQRAEVELIGDISDDFETMAESITQMCEDFAKMYDDYDVNCRFEMEPKKHQDKPEE